MILAAPINNSIGRVVADTSTSWVTLVRTKALDELAVL
jgi:hypothetical protein